MELVTARLQEQKFIMILDWEFWDVQQVKCGGAGTNED